MIDINELRRLTQDQEWIGRWYDAGCETLMAERNGEHEEVAHPYPIGLVPYLVAVQPTAVSELLDRLEAAEKDITMKEDVIDSLGVVVKRLDAQCDAAEKAATEAYQRGYETGQEEIEKERDELRAKIECMERQEPVAWMSSRNGFICKENKNPDYNVPLYAHPVAQPAPSVPVDVIADYLVSISAHLARRDDAKAQAEIGELLKMIAAVPKPSTQGEEK